MLCFGAAVDHRDVPGRRTTGQHMPQRPPPVRGRPLTADGVAVLLSGHLMADVEALCGSVTVLRSGQVA